MPNLIFTTVGTSIFQSNEKHNVYQKKINIYEKEKLKPKDIFNHEGDKTIIGFYDLVLKDVKTCYPNKIEKTSAEIQSLYQMKKEGLIDPSQDKLVLLHSDTMAGKIAADILYDFFQDKDNLYFSKIEKPVLMKNIRGDDAEKFTDGLHKFNYFILSNSHNQERNILINFTGGYKGMIPAITMFYNELINNGNNATLCYLYEQTDKIISFKISGGLLEVDEQNSTIDREING